MDARSVAKILNPALFSHDKDEARRAASPYTVTSARIDAIDEVRKVLDAAALATREEAPAEAGENWPMLADLHTIKGWLHGLSTAPAMRTFSARISQQRI